MFRFSSLFGSLSVSESFLNLRGAAFKTFTNWLGYKIGEQANQQGEVEATVCEVLKNDTTVGMTTATTCQSDNWQEHQAGHNRQLNQGGHKLCVGIFHQTARPSTLPAISLARASVWPRSS